MRRYLALALLFFLAAFTARAASPHGAWHLSQREDGRMQIEMISDHNQNSHPIERSAFTGLTAAQIDANADTPVDFRMIREAGTMHFTGTFQHGDGVGRFTFEPNPAYAATLRSLGVAASDLDDEHLFTLAVHDVSSSFIKEMQSLGYRDDLDQYVAFRIHGATPEFVREINALGYKPDSGDLIAFRIHGATPSFIRDIRALGYQPDAGDLVAFRIHGVSPEFIKGMKELGVRDLGDDNLVALRIHGASVNYVRDLRDLGYPSLSADDLVSMCIHGVSASYIRDLKNAGYARIPVEKLVEMKIHGIDAEFVKRTK
ncbi:MAG TPA: hypothetical protein VGQ65_05705 [Thermoanaerobaculia bacterium]|jgi:hypothetical protein|nr:hypothetical protein [Thermoanaerobaculia bacterium]